MIVDQQHRAVVVAIGCVPAEMDLANILHREIIDERGCVEPVIDRLYEQIVDVEEKPATGTPHDLPQELHLAHRHVGEGHIGGWVLESHAPPEPVLHLVDILADARQRLLRVGQRQEIVEIDAVVARPGEMLREERGLVALDQRFDPAKMLPIKRARAPSDSPTPCNETGYRSRMAPR